MKLFLSNEIFSFYQCYCSFLLLQKFIIDLHVDMRQLKSTFDYLYKRRGQASVAGKVLADQLTHLATCEYHPILAMALIELAAVQMKLEEIDSDNTQQEFSLMNELLNDYLLHLDMVKYVFNEREKAHKCCQLTVDTLQKQQLQKVGHTSKIYGFTFIDK
jgi:hypothetical protein